MSNRFPSCDKETIVHQLVEVEARVTVLPLVRPGRPKVYCIDSYIKEDCEDDDWKEKSSYVSRKRHEKEKDTCTFIVTQVICVEVPITIGADVDVCQGISHCDTPGIGSCRLPCKKDNCRDDRKEDDTDETGRSECGEYE